MLVFVCLGGMAQSTTPSNAPAGDRDAKGFLNPPGPSATTAIIPLPGLTAAAPTPRFEAPAAPPETSAPIATPAPASAITSSGYVLDDKHKLLAGDRVSFQIIEDRTNAIPLLVAESAELDFPYIGRVSVAGKTCRQAADEIKALLEKDYYFKATVVIGLDSLTKVLGKVYIFGPVRVPGPQEIPSNENFTAGKAILRAGGFGDFANRRKVQVIRKTDTGNKTMIINMENVLEKGKSEEDVTLQPEDFIIVPQRAINW